MNNFTIAVDEAGIALITFDVPGRSMNTLTGEVVRELGEIATRLSTDDTIKGAVFTSGKTSGFCAGADLGELGGGSLGSAGGEAGLRALFDACFTLNKTFRAIETCGKPVAAALNGLALGGGLDNAVVMDDYKVLNAGGLRYDDEFAKHKILDAMGDLAVIGKPLLGAYSAFRSGHALNNRLLRALLAQPQAYEIVSFGDEKQAPAGFARPARAW